MPLRIFYQKCAISIPKSSSVIRSAFNPKAVSFFSGRRCIAGPSQFCVTTDRLSFQQDRRHEVDKRVRATRMLYRSHHGKHKSQRSEKPQYVWKSSMYSASNASASFFLPAAKLPSSQPQPSPNWLCFALHFGKCRLRIRLRPSK